MCRMSGVHIRFWLHNMYYCCEHTSNDTTYHFLPMIVRHLFLVHSQTIVKCPTIGELSSRQPLFFFSRIARIWSNWRCWTWCWYDFYQIPSKRDTPLTWSWLCQMDCTVCRTCVQAHTFIFDDISSKQHWCWRWIQNNISLGSKIRPIAYMKSVWVWVLARIKATKFDFI